ncbi:hypothetical protein N0V82_004385 [Gnomoniopsis sp. IMI 355080]|nr:hypothetical protein N0V82_004385 [Gnomoniopsis sp. IMI 355080]
MTEAVQYQTLVYNEKNENEMRQSNSSLLEYEMCTEFKDYKYEDLGVPSATHNPDDYRDKKRFRLLKLMSGVLQDAAVYCKIFEVEFNIAKDEVRIVQDSGCVTPDRCCNNTCTCGNAPRQSISYEAMSWRWGNESERKYAIIIKTKDGDRKKTVSYTLGLALKYLRHSTKSRMIWIDALCINQDNFDERSSQVAMMDRLYTGASQICVWLGQDDPDSKIAIKFIKEEINELRDFDKLCKNSKHAGKWRALLGLMQRDWFSRRWVVQEIALARKATVYCGPDKVDWRDLAIAIELFVEVESATHRLSELMKKDDRFNVIPNWFEHISELGASLLVTETSKIFRDYKRKSDRRPLGLGHLTLSGPGRRSLLSLEYLVTSLSIFDCGRPHDFVYALVAISRDAFPSPPTSITQRSKEALVTEVMKGFVERKPFPLDYDIPYPDVARDFIDFTIQRHQDTGKDEEKALDILCRPWSKEWRLVDEDIQEQNTEDHKKGLFKDRGVNQKALEFWRDKVKKNDLGSEIISEESCQMKWEPWFQTKKCRPQARGGKAHGSVTPITSAVVAAETLPSWVSDVTKAPFDIFRHPGVEITKMGRKNADPLVGNLDNGEGTYSAAQSKKQNREEIKFKKRARLGHYSLYVRGFRFDKVDIVEQVSQQGAIPASWLELGGWETAIRPKSPGTDPGIPPDALWRTLVADRGMYNQNPPYYYSRACKETIMKGALRSNAVDTTALIYNERNSIIAEFCRRTQCVIWNRAMIKTKNGHLGLVSPNVKKGDLVCIIYGCTVPVILRKAESLKTGKERRDEMKDDCLETFKRCFKKCLERRARKFEYQKQSTEGDHKENVAKELEHWKVKTLAQTMLDSGVEDTAIDLWRRSCHDENGALVSGEHPKGVDIDEVRKAAREHLEVELKTWMRGHPWKICCDAVLTEIDAFEESAKVALLKWKQRPNLPKSVKTQEVKSWLKTGPNTLKASTVLDVNSWMDTKPKQVHMKVEVPDGKQIPDLISIWRWLGKPERGWDPKTFVTENVDEAAFGNAAQEPKFESWLRWLGEKPGAFEGHVTDGQQGSVKIDIKQLTEKIKKRDKVKEFLDDAVKHNEDQFETHQDHKLGDELGSWKKAQLTKRLGKLCGSVEGPEALKVRNAIENLKTLKGLESIKGVELEAHRTKQWSQMPLKSSLELKLTRSSKSVSGHFSSDEESDGDSEDDSKDRGVKCKEDEQAQSDSDSDDEGTENAGGNENQASFTRSLGKKARQSLADERDPFRHYEFLGEAYIHGMMEGEAVSQSFYKKKPEHIFEIR